MVLSILIPGLGHAYLGLLLRGLIWFGGAIALSVVLRGTSSSEFALTLGFATGLGLLAAGDLLLLERASGGRRRG